MLLSAVSGWSLPSLGRCDPTLRLLLACARPPGAPVPLAELCRSPVDWPQLPALAARHGLVPLVSGALAGQPAVPEPVHRQLAAGAISGSARILLLAAHLHELLAVLSHAGIAVFVHKGLAIGAMAYGDILLRHAGDLDLVIRPADLPRARLLLENLGYAAKAAAPRPGGYHLGFRRASSGVTVELHWAFTSARWPFPLSQASLWSSLTTVPVAGHPAPCLVPAMAVLALCAHGTKEAWARLGLLADLAALLTRYPDLPWEAILACARRMRREQAVLLGFALAAVCLGLVLPPELTRRMGQFPRLPKLCRQVIRSYETGQPISGLSFHCFLWRVMETGHDRRVYWAATGPVLARKLIDWMRPTEADRPPVRALRWLPYVQRPVRIVRACGGPWSALRLALRRLG